MKRLTVLLAMIMVFACSRSPSYQPKETVQGPLKVATVPQTGPAATEQAKGTLVVTTNLEEAEIYFRDQMVGYGRAERPVAVGPGKLLVLHEKFKDKEFDLTIREGETTSLEVTLDEAIEPTAVESKPHLIATPGALLTYDQIFSVQERHYFQQRRDRMVERQIIDRGITEDSILKAMRKVPMELFAPPQVHRFLYLDKPVPVDYDETISMPYISAFLLSQVDLKTSERVLELKSGSGYQTALISTMVNMVYGVESEPALIALARSGFAIGGYKNIQLKHGDCRLGWPEIGPYDVIIATAAFAGIPEHLFEQLTISGRMIIPINVGQFEETTENHQILCLYTKQSDGTIELKKLMPVRFAMMPGEAETAG